MKIHSKMRLVSSTQETKLCILLIINSGKKNNLPKNQKTLKKHEIKATVFHLNQNESDSKNIKINEGFFVLKI